MRRLTVRILGLTLLAIDIHDDEPASTDDEDDTGTYGADAATVISTDTLPPMFGFTPYSTSREDWFE